MNKVIFFIFILLLLFHCGQKDSAVITDQVYTIAFEDSFPEAGDGDYNDYVVVANYKIIKEGDLTRKIEASFTHVARGSDLRQILMLKLPAASNASVRHKIHNSNGSVKQSDTFSSLAASELAEGIVILPDDKKNSPRNVARGQQFESGLKAEVEIVFNSPVAAGQAPFDLYLFLPNREQEIHIRDTNSKGFPAAVAVPGVWKWQYNGTSLYQDNSSGYEGFDDWARTGSPAKWYASISDGSKVYPVPETDIAGFIMGKSDKNMMVASVLLLLLGIFLGFYLRKKTVEA